MEHSVAVISKLATIVCCTTISSAISQRLELQSITPAPNVGSVIIGPVHCDSRGNLFLSPPLSKVTPDGQRAAVYDLSAAMSDGIRNPVVKAFGINPDGRVYELLRLEQEQVAIAIFNEDGSYKRAITLDERFEPQQLAIFSGDVFMVSGLKFRKGRSTPEVEQYIGMFDRNGKLVKKVDFSEKAFTSDPQSEARFNVPELGILESDGAYAYMLHQGSNPTVWVISSIGTVERKLKLVPPHPNSVVSNFRVGSGMLLIEFSRQKALPNGNTAYDLVLYDAQTGDRLSEYLRDPDLLGILGCPDWKGTITLLGTDPQGNRVLIRTSVR